MGAIADGAGDRYQIGKDEELLPKGIEERVPYKRELRTYMNQLVAGLRKGMGHCGCKSIVELNKYGKYIKITAAGLRESHPHTVTITQEAPNYSRL